MTLASLFILDKRRKSYDKTRKYKYVILYLGIMIILLALLLYYEDTSNIISGLWGRALEDTRSRQYLDFFSQVPIADLLLGRGPTGTWIWGGRDYQYFDNAYIWMALIGGLPILVSYFMVTIWPGIKAYILRAKGNDAAAAMYIMLIALAFTGLSTYLIPSLSPQIYLLYLMTGRCLAYLAEIRPTKQKSSNRYR